MKASQRRRVIVRRWPLLRWTRMHSATLAALVLNIALLLAMAQLLSAAPQPEQTPIQVTLDEAPPAPQLPLALVVSHGKMGGGGASAARRIAPRVHASAPRHLAAAAAPQMIVVPAPHVALGPSVVRAPSPLASPHDKPFQRFDGPDVAGLPGDGGLTGGATGGASSGHGPGLGPGDGDSAANGPATTAAKDLARRVNRVQCLGCHVDNADVEIRPRPIEIEKLFRSVSWNLGGEPHPLTLICTITDQGLVTNARVALSSGNSDVDASAIDLLKMTRWEPARISGIEVPIEAVFPMKVFY